MSTEIVVTTDPPRTKFYIRNFLQLVRVVTLATQKRWPLTIIGTGEEKAFSVVTSEAFAQEIRKELGP